MREVARHFGWSSTSTAQQHLEALEKKGRLTRTPNSPRSLRVTKPLREVGSNQTIAVPLVGRIAAGAPIFALEEAEEVLALSTRFVPRKQPVRTPGERRQHDQCWHF